MAIYFGKYYVPIHSIPNSKYVTMQVSLSRIGSPCRPHHTWPAIACH